MSSGSNPWRIAVTGLSGFVGSHFRDYVASLGRPDVEILPLGGADGRSIDIRDGNRVFDAMAASRPDVVLHLAAVALPSSAKADPVSAWNINVIGTLNIAQAILAQGAQTRLIYVGSSEAYGESFLGGAAPLSEDAPLVPRSAYGATKAAADLMVGQMALDGLRAIRFRPFNHAGPGQTADYVISAFARQVARIERDLQPPVMRVGNLDAERDFLSVRDVVSAYARAALPEADWPNGDAVNLSTGEPLRIRAILTMLLAMADKRITVETDPTLMRPNDIPRASGSPQRAKDMLGWQPLIRFDETLNDVLTFWRTNVSHQTVV